MMRESKRGFIGLVLGGAALTAAVCLGPASAWSKTVDSDFADMSWDEIVAEARGGTVNLYMWGGAANINDYISIWVAERAAAEYDITVNRVPITDTVEAVNKVLGEKEAGIDSGGGVDMIWINGENFRTLKENDMLFCGYMDVMPNNAYIDWSDPAVAYDFGNAVDECEVPWGRAQFVMVYNSANVDAPPTSMADFIQWVIDNPGNFTYPAPPDFTGTFFVSHVFFNVAGGADGFSGDFDQALFDETAPKVWEILNSMEPGLWREGTTYPNDRASMHQLYANGETNVTMQTHPANVGADVDKGAWPPTTRSFVFDGGTIANVHYMAIPKNAANKAAAIVVANLLISPEAQLEKSKPAVWGVKPAIDLSRLSEEERAEWDALPQHPSVVPDGVLNDHRVPQIGVQWVVPIEEGWQQNVAR